MDGWVGGKNKKDILKGIESGCVRERTRGVFGKGLDFPREALSEKEKERDGNTERLRFREEKHRFFLLNWAAASRPYSTTSRGKLGRSFLQNALYLE